MSATFTIRTDIILYCIMRPYSYSGKTSSVGTMYEAQNIYTGILYENFVYIYCIQYTLYNILNTIFLYYKKILFILLGITLIFFSLHSYDSLCNRGSELVLVIRLIQLYWKLSLNLQILLDM